MASLPPPQIFTLFPHLPIELRYRIFQLSLPAPRTIYLSTSIKNGRLIFIEYQHAQKPSPLLCTSWEARSCYLETYSKLALHTCTFIDPSMDTLHFDKKSFLYLLWAGAILSNCELASKEVIHAIKHIETDVDGIEEIVREQRMKEVIGPFLRDFSGLEEICWVLQKRGSFYRRFRQEEGPRFFLRQEDDLFEEAGKAALGDAEVVFGKHGKSNPKARIPALRVRVNLPGFLV